MISEIAMGVSLLATSSVPQPTYYTYQATTSYSVGIVCPLSITKIDNMQNRYGADHGVYSTQILDNLITGDLTNSSYYQITMISYLDYRDTIPTENVLENWVLDGTAVGYEENVLRDNNVSTYYSSDEEFEINLQNMSTFRFEDARKIYNQYGNIYFHFNAYIECQDMTYNDGLHIDSGVVNASLSTGDYSVGYETGYNNGYDGGYNVGYNNGFQNGYDYTENLDDYSIQSMLTTILDYPLKLVKQVTNVELFGVNLYSVITFALSITLIAFVIKYFI